MSIIYCEKHSVRWDSDKVDACPQCESGHCNACDTWHDCDVAMKCLNPERTNMKWLAKFTEDHIKSLEWHYATDDEKTLVVGNLRNFSACLEKVIGQYSDVAHDECAQREASVTHQWQMLARLVGEYQQYWQCVHEPYRVSLINADFAVREIGKARGRMFAMANDALPKEQLTEMRPTLGAWRKV